jgi:uncharacterized HAD superfamily protein
MSCDAHHFMTRFAVVTGLQEQAYSKKMFNDRADAVEKLAALQEELQQQQIQADINQKHAQTQQQHHEQQISALHLECTALKTKISSLEHEVSLMKEQSAAAAAASAAEASARIVELEHEMSAAVVAAQQQVSRCMKVAGASSSCNLTLF